MAVKLPALPTATSGTMLLTEARAMVRDYTRNGTDTSAYSDSSVDRAIASIGQRFCRKTQYLRLSTDIVSADGVVEGMPVTFDPANLISVVCAGVASPLTVVPWDELRERSIRRPLTGTPRAIAFRDRTYASLYPTPADATTITMRYAGPFVTWTPGTASPNDVVLNLPNEILLEILPFGPPSLLMKAEPENAGLAARAWENYLEIERGYAGSGHLGQTEASREMAT
jgi:hypothetical protein